jgi:hypothetical protein
LKTFPRLSIVLGIAVVAISGCTTSQLGVTPNINFRPVNGKLFAAVGTANIDGEAALNVVATFRGPNGLSAVPISNATIAGPAGFGGPAGSLDPGAGLAVVPLGSAANNFTLQNALFGQSTNLAAIDLYGAGPPSDSAPNSAPNLYPAQPQFADVSAGSAAAFAVCPGPPVPLYGGPPAYPVAQQNFGYPEGFYIVASGLPPTGNYTVTLSYAQNGKVTNTSVAAPLGAASVLPTMAAPTYVSDGAGGGSGTVSVPAGVTEVLVNVIETNGGGCSPGAKYATALIKASGPQPYTIPGGTLDVGSSLAVQAVGFDYDAFGLGPPSNFKQDPGLPAQADLTISAETAATE